MTPPDSNRCTRRGESPGAYILRAWEKAGWPPLAEPGLIFADAIDKAVLDALAAVVKPRPPRRRKRS